MKGLLIHGTLAALGLVWAYRTWEDRGIKEKADAEVTVFECKASKLSSILLDEKKKVVRLQAKQAKGSPFYWFEVTTKANAAEKIKESKEQFAGNKDTEGYLNAALPFRASRSLGKVSGETLKDIQLDKPESKLEIACDGQTKKFAIGATTYGSGDYYVRAADGSGPVYLVQGSIIKDLQSASYKLMQRTLVAFELKDVDRIRVEASGKSRTLMQRDKGEQTAQWVDSSTPDRKNELFGNWLNKLQQLSVQQYLQPAKQPGSDLTPPATQSLPVLTLKYIKDGGDLDTLQMVKVTPASKDKNQPTEPQYYARTDATESWVRVTASIARQVEQDIEAVLSNKQPATGKDGARKGPSGFTSPHQAPGTAIPGLPPGHP